MVRFDHILLPTDFSPLAVQSSRFAASIAAAYNSTLHVVHVISTAALAAVAGEGGPVMPLPSRAQLLDELDRFVKAHLAGFRGRIEQAVVSGLPYEQLPRYAREHAIDLIVIGTHARGLVNRIFFGSTSKSVVEHAPCPVLMVPLVTAAAPAG
jgi:nucleotide-binding universal stress UspA family protein